MSYSFKTLGDIGVFFAQRAADTIEAAESGKRRNAITKSDYEKAVRESATWRQAAEIIGASYLESTAVPGRD